MTDYVKPADVAASMLNAGVTKLTLAPRDLMIRGMLSGAILGVATTLAFTGAVTTGQPIVGAIIFPIGLVSIVLLGFELVTAVSRWCLCRGSRVAPASGKSSQTGHG